MRSEAKKAFYFQANANSLGGFFEKPFQKVIPSQSSVSLPPSGGYVTSRTEAFNLDDVISCRSSHTRVSGNEVQTNGPWSVLITSVIEGLNILNVVTAERIVAQISAEYPSDGGSPRIGLAGSHFQDLRIGGFLAYPALNRGLLQPKPGSDASHSQLTWTNFQQTGREQAARLIDSTKGDDQNASSWIAERFGWLNSDRKLEDGGYTLCSLVDGVDQAIPGRSFGHVVEIPDFGRIFLGELLVTQTSIQISMIRADLGCVHSATATAGSGVVGGHMVPP